MPYIARNNKNPFLLQETINDDIRENSYNIKSNICEGIEEYSFRCLTNNLNYKIKKGTKEVLIKFILENNGKFTWPENGTFLLTNEAKSDFRIQEISLNPLEPGKKVSISITIINFDKFNLGLKKIYLVLNIKGKNYGYNIIINIEIY
jgi:hypothetical protein